MLGWSLLPTGPITPNGVSNACSPAIRGWGFCGMQMPVTRARLNLLPQKDRSPDGTAGQRLTNYQSSCRVLLGSAGSLPAGFGSLPNTIFVGKLPTNAG